MESVKLGIVQSSPVGDRESTLSILRFRQSSLSIVSETPHDDAQMFGLGLGKS